MLDDYKIKKWKQAVSTLDDRPQMTAKALKAAFDSNSEDIKTALNGLADYLGEGFLADYLQGDFLNDNSGLIKIDLPDNGGTYGATLQTFIQELYNGGYENKMNILGNADELISVGGKISSISRRVKALEEGGGGGSAVDSSIVTPEQFGAKGDGVTDDAPALQAAMKSGRPVRLTQDLYLKSAVKVLDVDRVELDGCGHTLHEDGAGYTYKTLPHFIDIYSSSLSESDEGWESAEMQIVMDNGEYFHDTFHRGYVARVGENPVEETYEDYRVQRFRSRRAEVRNLHIICTNCAGMVALALRKMCHSIVDHVTVNGIGDPSRGFKDSPSVGIMVDTCFQCAVRNCYTYGFTDGAAEILTSRGYGLNINGNDILVDGCTSWDCKHAISTSGNRSYWSTNIRVQNCSFGLHWTYDKRTNGAYLHQQVVDSHAAGRGVVFSDCMIEILDAGDSGSPVAFLMSAPDVRLININVRCDGAGCYGNAHGYAQKIYMDNVKGENLYLNPNSAYIDAREFHLNNCLFKRVVSSYNHPIKLYLRNTIVRELVDDVQWIWAEGCVFKHEIGWGSHACIKIRETGIFTNCEIYGHTEETIAPSRSIIEAPENSIKMTGCMIYVRQNGKIFDHEQNGLGVNWTENIFGWRFDEEHNILDSNELF